MPASPSPFFRAVLHSYAMLFFSQHRGFAAVLLMVSFGHPVVGAAGLASTCLAVAGARLGGFNREWTDSGAYSFNALLTGLALASFFAPGWGLAGLVVVGAGLALLLSVALGGWLGGRGLPFLSLPFVGTVWLLLLGAGPLLHLPPAEGGTYWLNEAYALGGPRLAAAAQWVAGWPWPPLLATYLRALSAVLFQDSALAGLLVAAGLLWHSRIAFSLSVLGFLGAYGLLLLTGPAGSGPLDYNLGANYVVAAVAVGGVFVIPSAASYGWALLSVPVTVVALAGFTAVLDRLGLPALSLPYCATALLFLYVLLLRERPGAALVLTPIQRYSPERNLYAYATARVRLAHQGAVALTLPFRGAWTCTQGYLSGGPTHLGDWGHALDFAITDADGRTYHGSGLSLSDYYAYNKPVLAPADGVVEEVIQHIEDNAIGEVNTRQNWGNTVVLRHAPGLFTQLSHLRAHSVPVKVGDYVRRGDIIGTCGSSGRSPEPHLHFQVQATPYVGSRTLASPLAYFVTMPAGDAAQAADAPTMPPKMHPKQTLRALGRAGTRPGFFKAPSGEPGSVSATAETLSAKADNASATAEMLSATAESVSAMADSVSATAETLSVMADSVSATAETLSAVADNISATTDRLLTLPKTPQLRHFAVPAVGDVVSPPAFNRTLSQALRLPPGYALDVRDAAAPAAPPQRWEVFTDAYNLAYLRCQRTGAVLYFAGDESVFYCTAFYGDESSWLYLLYQAAYRVPLASLPGQLVHDEFPLTVVRNPILTWVQDLLAPFYRFLCPTFWAEEVPATAGHWPGGPVRLRSRVVVAGFGRTREVQAAELLFAEGRLAELRVRRATGSLTLTCTVAGA
ncbi:MAG: hypothetical protein JWP58_1161 [Hymenobacter sp.]|nr:hypothetical protein [Hymenobacter sp.]